MLDFKMCIMFVVLQVCSTNFFYSKQVKKYFGIYFFINI